MIRTPAGTSSRPVRFVELHDGTIHAHSEGRGKGTQVVLRFPALTSLVEGRTCSLTHGDTAGVTPNGPSRRVLVVDDNVDAVTSLTVWLQQNGHITQSAFDGADGVARALAWSPDVILLDIGLPKMDGYDACRAIREELPNTSTRIIALTGWGQREDRARSHAAGFDAHLVKPVDLAVLHRILAES